MDKILGQMTLFLLCKSKSQFRCEAKLSCEGGGSEAAATEVSTGDQGDLVGDPTRGVETVHLAGAAAAATPGTGAALHTS